MWKLLYGSTRGTSHERFDQPCQDYSFGTITSIAGQRILIVACADGAGTASLSQIGARVVTHEFVRCVIRDFESGLDIKDVDKTTYLNWTGEARAAIEDAAIAHDVPIRDLACTLLTAVVADAKACFSQIGDGAIVVDDNSTLRAVFWPQSGEYANTTNFISDREFFLKTEFVAVDRIIQQVAVLTDGLQALALDFAAKQPHSPFFAPMFRALQAARDTDELYAPLIEFLNSPAVIDRTDDDKTLMLAMRQSADEPDAL